MNTSLRVMYCALGWLFFGTGLVGAFLPVLPTTPFMILALWMFSKSSARFHAWLYHHRLFGPALQKWQQYRVIPARAKLASVSMMSISFIYMLIYSPVSWWLQGLIGLLMLYGAGYVLSKPSRPPAGMHDAAQRSCPVLDGIEAMARDEQGRQTG
ncbi:MAG: YbaN family protein [Gammaproteobacteria bacterium]